MTNWIKSVFTKARQVVLEEGKTPSVDVHRDGDDGRVVKILLSGENDTIRITWGQGTLQDYW